MNARLMLEDNGLQAGKVKKAKNNSQVDSRGIRRQCMSDDVIVPGMNARREL